MSKAKQQAASLVYQADCEDAIRLAVGQIDDKVPIEQVLVGLVKAISAGVDKVRLNAPGMSRQGVELSVLQAVSNGSKALFHYVQQGIMPETLVINHGKNFNDRSEHKN